MIYLVSTPNSLPDLIAKLFSYPVGNIFFKGAKTWSDKDCTIVQCEECKYRSFEDVLECAQTYFPDTTEEFLLKLLLSIIFESSERKYYLTCYNCNLILKPTICFFHSFNGKLGDEKFSSKPEKFVDDDLITWRDMFNKIGVFTDLHVTEFRSNPIIVKI